jgi:hypothetical protein
MRDKLEQDALEVVNAAVGAESFARKEEIDEARVRLLARIGAYLSGPRREAAINDALDAVRRILSEEGRVRAIGHLAPLLDGTQIYRGLGYAREIKEPAGRARTLRELVRTVPEVERKQVIDEALSAIRSIDDGATRASEWVNIVPIVDTLSPDSLYEIWREALHSLAGGRRRTLLENFVSLRPAIVALGGRAAFATISDGLRKSGQWWP